MVTAASKWQTSGQPMIIFLLTIYVAAHEPPILVETPAGPDKYDFDMDDPHPIDQMAMETTIHQVYLLPDSNTSLSSSNDTKEIPGSFQQLLDSSETEALSTVNTTFVDVPALNNNTVLDLSEADTLDLEHINVNEDPGNSTEDQIAIPSETLTYVSPVSKSPVHNITASFSQNISSHIKSTEATVIPEVSLELNTAPESSNISADGAPIQPSNSAVDAAKFHLPQTDDSLHEKRQANFSASLSNPYQAPVWDDVYKGIYPSRPFLLPEYVYGPPKRPEPFVLRRNKQRVKGRKRIGAKRPSQRFPQSNEGSDSSFSSDESSADVSIDESQLPLEEELVHISSVTPLAYGAKSRQSDRIETTYPEHSSFTPLSVLALEKLDIKYNSPKEVLEKYPPRNGVQPDGTLSFIDGDSISDDPLNQSVFPLEESQEKFTELEESISGQEGKQGVYKHQNYYADSFRQLAYIPEEAEDGKKLHNKTEIINHPAQLTSEITFSPFEDSKDEVFQFEESERDTFATQLEEEIPQSLTTQSSLLNFNSDLYEGLRLPYYSLFDGTIYSNQSISVHNNSQIGQAAQNLTRNENGFDVQSPESSSHALHEKQTSTANIQFPTLVQENSSRPVGPTSFSQNFPNVFTPNQTFPGFQNFPQTPLGPHVTVYEPQLQDYYDPALFEYLDAIYRAQQGYHVPDYLYDYDYESDFVNGQLGRPPLDQVLSPPPPTGNGNAIQLPLDFNKASQEWAHKQNFLPTGLAYVTNANLPITTRGNGEFLNAFQRPFQNPVEFVQSVNGNSQESQEIPTLFSQQNKSMFPAVLQGQTGTPQLLQQNVNGFSNISTQNNPFLSHLLSQAGIPLISSQEQSVLLNAAQGQIITQANKDPSQNEFLLAQQRHTDTQFGIPLPILSTQTAQPGQNVGHFGNNFLTSPSPTLQFQTTSSNFPTTPKLRFTEDSILSIKPQTPVTGKTNVRSFTSTLRTQKPITLTSPSEEDYSRSQIPTSHPPQTKIQANSLPGQLPSTKGLRNQVLVSPRPISHTSRHQLLRNNEQGNTFSVTKASLINIAPQLLSAADLPNDSQHINIDDNRDHSLQIESSLGDRQPENLTRENAGILLESLRDISETPAIITSAPLSPGRIRNLPFNSEPAATNPPKGTSSATSSSLGSTDHEFSFGSGLITNAEIIQQLHLLGRDGALRNDSMINSPLLRSIGILQKTEPAGRNLTDSLQFISREKSEEHKSVTKLKPEMANIRMNSLEKLMALKTSDPSDIPTIIRNFIAAQRNFRNGETIKSATTMSTLGPLANTQQHTFADVSTVASGSDALADNSEEYRGEFIIFISNKSTIYPKDGEFIVIIPQLTASSLLPEEFSVATNNDHSARDGDSTPFLENLNRAKHDEILDTSPQTRIHTTSRRGAPHTQPPSIVQTFLENESDIPLAKRRVSEKRTKPSVENESKWFAPYSDEYGRREYNSNKEFFMMETNITDSAFPGFNNTEVEISQNSDPNELKPSLNLTVDEKRGFTLEDYYNRYIPTTQSTLLAVHDHLGTIDNSDNPIIDDNHDIRVTNIADFNSPQQFGYFYEGSYPDFWSGQSSSLDGYPTGLHESQNLVTAGSVPSASFNEKGITTPADTVLVSPFPSDGTYNNDNSQHPFNLPITQQNVSLPKDTSDYSLKDYVTNVPNPVSLLDDYNSTETKHDREDSFVTPLLPNGIETKLSLEAENILDVPHIALSSLEIPINSPESGTFATPNADKRNINYNSLSEPFVTTDIPNDDQPLLQHSAPFASTGYVREESLLFPVFDVINTTLLPQLRSTPFPTSDAASDSHHLLNKETTNELPDSLKPDFLKNITISTIPTVFDANHADIIQNTSDSKDNSKKQENPLSFNAEQILSSIADIMERDTTPHPGDSINAFEESVIPFRQTKSALVLGRENLASVEDFELLPNNTVSPTGISEPPLQHSMNLDKSAHKGNLINFTLEHLNASIVPTEVTIENRNTEELVEEILTDNSNIIIGVAKPSLKNTANNEIAGNVTVTANNTIAEDNESKSDDLLSTETLPKDSRIVTIDLGIVPFNSLSIFNLTNNVTVSQTKQDALDAYTIGDVNILSSNASNSSGSRIEEINKNQGKGGNAPLSNQTTSEFDNIDSDAIIRNQQDLQKNGISHQAKVEIANLDASINFPFDGLDIANMSGLKVELTLPGIQIIDVTPLAKQPGSSANFSQKGKGKSIDILKNDEEFLNDQVLIIADERNPIIQGIPLEQREQTNIPLVTETTTFTSTVPTGNYADYFIDAPTADTESNLESVGKKTNTDVRVRFNPIVNGDTIRNVNIESTQSKAKINFKPPVVSDFSSSGADLFNSQEPIILLESPLKLESIEETPQQISEDDLITFPHVVSSSIILADRDYAFSDDTNSKENDDFDYAVPEPITKFASNFDSFGSNTKSKIPGRVDDFKVTVVHPEVIVGTSTVKQQISPLSLRPTPTVERITETSTKTIYVPVDKKFSSTVTPQRLRTSSKTAQITAFKPSSQIGSTLSGFRPSAPRFQVKKPFLSASQSQDEFEKWVWNGQSGLPLRKSPLGLSRINPSELIAFEQSSLAPTYRDLPRNDAVREKKEATSKSKLGEERWVWDPVNRRGAPAEPNNRKPPGIDEWLSDDYLFSSSVVSYLNRKLDERANDNSSHDVTPKRTTFASTSPTTKIPVQGQFLWKNNNQHGVQRESKSSAIEAGASVSPEGFFPESK